MPRLQLLVEPLSRLVNSILIGLLESLLLAKLIELNVIVGLKCTPNGQKKFGDVLCTLMSLLSACVKMAKLAFGDFTTKGTKQDVV